MILHFMYTYLSQSLINITLHYLTFNSQFHTSQFLLGIIILVYISCFMCLKRKDVEQARYTGKCQNYRTHMLNQNCQLLHCQSFSQRICNIVNCSKNISHTSLITRIILRNCLAYCSSACLRNCRSQAVIVIKVSTS